MGIWNFLTWLKSKLSLLRGLRTKESTKYLTRFYPIQNYGGNIKLKFAGYEFGEPKYNAEESMYRECNYAAPLKARMELEITDNQTGEVINKWEDVFLGDFL